MNKLWFVLVVVFVALFLIHRGKGGGSDGKKPVIYGSMGCPHTVTLVERMGQGADFVDCSNGGCPDFVEAYPTTQFPDGKIKVGA
jgi:hypothetical protein